MQDLEVRLKDLIMEKYGNLKRFADTVGMPWTTLDSILKRGVANSNISNVLKITKELKIDTERLMDGTIECNAESIPTTIAAHFEGEEYSEDELEEIRQFAAFVKNRRK